MKKIITLFVLLTFFKGFTQCPAPSNLILSSLTATTVNLTWTENGTATAWEIAIIPDYNIGDPMPTFGTVYSGTTPYTINGLTPGFGCYAFLVRSVCSATEVSPWAAVGSLGCSTNVYNYLATLSNNDFYVNDSKVKVYPNPTHDFLFIDTIEKQIQKIEIFDLQGRLIKTINENKNKYQIDISNLQSATYLVKLSTQTETQTVKFVKK
jgi:hypothetical protein